RFVGYGRISAVAVSLATKTVRAVWFQSRDGKVADYFTERGENIARRFVKTPLKSQRVPGGFDRRRFHPVLHTDVPLWGVDFAAPVSTPVIATHGGKIVSMADGTLALRSFGKPVIETTYMHLSRFARNLAVGKLLRPQQILGYVGVDKGGPHLHYAVSVAGVLSDPLTISSPH